MAHRLPLWPGLTAASRCCTLCGSGRVSNSCRSAPALAVLLGLRVMLCHECRSEFLLPRRLHHRATGEGGLPESEYPRAVPGPEPDLSELDRELAARRARPEGQRRRSES